MRSEIPGPDYDYGFSTSYVNGKHVVAVLCEDGTTIWIGEADALGDALSNGGFGLLVCANLNILPSLTLPEAGTSVSRPVLESSVTTILSALPTPLEISDLSMGNGASATHGESVATRSGTYTVTSSSTWSWTGSCATSAR
ncbi:MAG: hypothetical protein OXH41_04170 [Chloroflexi bacterium]|nr:hypothetical protein [Chloroflexota bacterium]